MTPYKMLAKVSLNVMILYEMILKKAQRIYPVGKAWLIKNKVLPLQHESYPTSACHPSRCSDRQF